MCSIAVIVANRNNARFLCQCLDSILNQSLRPKEVIVVDDASEDDSDRVLIPYVRDKAITLIRNRTRQGVAAARHLAITRSSAKYVTTLDADDFYFNKDKLAAEAEAVGKTDVGGRIAFSDVMRADEAGRAIRLISRSRSIRQGDLWFSIRHLNGFIPRDYLVAREDYFAAGGFDPTLGLYEDWDLKIRLSIRCRWYFSGVVGTAYRCNPSGLSNARRSEHISTMRRIFLKYCPAERSIPRAISFARFFIYHSLYMRSPAI